MPTKKGKDKKIDRREDRNRLRHPHMEAQLSYLSDELKSTQNVDDNNGKIKQILEEVLKHWMLNYIKVTTSIY